MKTLKHIVGLIALIIAFTNISIAQYNNKASPIAIDNTDPEYIETFVLRWFAALNEIKQEAKASDKDFETFTNFNQYYLDSERCALFQLAKAGIINDSNVNQYLNGKKTKLQALYAKFLEIKKEYPSTVEKFKSLQHPTIPIGCNPSCTNIDFSSGDFTGWNGYYAVNSSTTNHKITSVTGGPLGAVVRGAEDPFTKNTYQMHITSKSNMDWFLKNYYGINMPQASPWGGNYSAMIGDSVNNGSGVAILSQQFMVTAATNSFTYAYSVLLENPNHPYYEQPFFSVIMLDQNGDTIKNCGIYDVVSGPTMPGYKGLYYPVYKDTVYWKNWTLVNVPLSNYIGQNVTIEFEISDCEPSWHFGYAYVAASCSNLTISQSSSAICGNGTMVLTAPAGEAGYLWTGPANGIIGSKTQQSVTVDSAGTYTAVITPVTGDLCKDSLKISILRDILSVKANNTNVTCNGGTNGSAATKVTNGTPPYTYSWNTVPVQTNAIATNLKAGNYTVTVTDVNSCSATATVAISEPALLTASMGVPVNVSCNGGNNGNVTVTASGGTSPCTYSWNTVPVQTNAIATNLKAGNYTVTVTDVNSCSAT
ncbi:MAG: SprB repeat-containing protein, partial [Bacteroidia bacterium]